MLAAAALPAIFFLLFLTELDRELVRRGLPIPGVILFAAAMAGFAAWLLTSRSGPTIQETREHVLQALRLRWPFLLALLLLAVLTWIQWPRNPDAHFRDAVLPVIILAMTAAAMLLPLAPGVRRRWRLYLLAAFLFYCCTALLDVFRPGTFTSHDFRAAGLAVDPNVGAFMVLILMSPILSYRRFSFLSLAVLFVAGFAVFMTLSRSGLLGYAVFFAAFSLRVVWAARGRRIMALGSFTAMAALLAAACWLSIQTLPYFDRHAAIDRLNQLAGQELFTYSVDLGRDSDMWVLDSRLDEYKEYSRVVQSAVLAATAAAPAPADGASHVLSGVDEPTADPAPGDARADREVSLEASILRDNIRVTDDVLTVDVPRLVHLKNSWRLITLSPVWGYGAAFSIRNGVEPHVMFMLAWINLGILGLLLYSALLAAGFWIFIRERFWPGVFLMGLVAYFSMFSQTVLESRPLFVLLGLLLGLTFALRRYGDPDPELPAAEAQ